MPSQLIAVFFARYCAAVFVCLSEGWPGVVLPRSTPGRKVRAPPEVWSWKCCPSVPATIPRPFTSIGAGAQELPFGGAGMSLIPAMRYAGELGVTDDVPPARTRH